MMVFPSAEQTAAPLVARSAVLLACWWVDEWVVRMVATKVRRLADRLVGNSVDWTVEWLENPSVVSTAVHWVVQMEFSWAELRVRWLAAW